MGELLRSGNVGGQGDNASIKPFIELSSSERMPINMVTLRRDKTSFNGKLRKKYINICSNIRPKEVIINGVFCPHKLTRGLEIIKINVGHVIQDLPSGVYELQITVKHDHGEINDIILLNYRARKHYQKRLDQNNGGF